MMLAALIGTVVKLLKCETAAVVAISVYAFYALAHVVFPFHFHRFGYPMAPLVILTAGAGIRDVVTWLKPSQNISLPTRTVVLLLIGLVVYTGTFIAEIVRGSILAISKGQTEAAEALGLNALQRLRFVIMPQAMRIMIPPLTNQYLNLMKNSSLAIAVAFKDLFGVGDVTINQAGQAVPMVALLMAAYVSLSLTISAVMNGIYSRLKWRSARQ